MQLQPGPDSKDIAFEEHIPEVYDERTIWSSCGKTKEVEDESLQPLLVDVCVYWTSVPDQLVVPQHGARVMTFAMTVDSNRTVAREELLKGRWCSFGLRGTAWPSGSCHKKRLDG